MKSVNEIFNEASLTQPQKKIAIYMLDEHSAEEIAQKVSMKTKAVKYHMTMVYKKIGVKNRTQFVFRVLKQIVDIPKLVTQEIELPQAMN
ncbi:MAG: helix-turn-helix transcriptional regulator [Pseudobdellovibrionaceae bacterium]